MGTVYVHNNNNSPMTVRGEVFKAVTKMAFLLLTFWWDLVLCVGTLLVSVYLWFLWRFNYWNRKGMHSPKAVVPFGHFKEVMLNKAHVGEKLLKIYQNSKSHKYVGIFMLHRPTFIINDLEFVKIALVRDFVHFSDHGFHYDEELEPIAGHLFNATGEKWKKLRIKLTPTFTSSKMKQMFDVVKDCSTEMLGFLEKSTEVDNITDMKELLAKLNTDIIGNCAFGLSCNSFKNPDAEFRRMGRKIFEPSTLENIVGLLDFFIPNVFTRLKAKVLGSEMQDFFLKIVEDTVKYREDNNIVRNDFLQLLIELMHSSSIKDDTGKLPIHFMHFH